MYGLGDVSGGSTTSVSPSNLNGNRGGVMSVVRALGVLVCEGRIQGPPRGYREGPHCAAPLQSAPNNHICEKDNYLCNRYFVLVKEIADRTAIGVSLCVEVFMCSDCPCGLATATCNDPVSSIPSTSITQWPQTSEMLLEYWCIRVLPSKSSEIMNFQGLYQAVRSRLHFSQVAAWWSRSNGLKPTYVATRVVPCNTDNLRKFREQPIEHTFPLASIGDGNSVKVTVWALPRIEEVPELICHVHPTTEKIEDDAARALTPTKNTPSSSSSSTITQHPETCLVLPILVDDRLQTPCDQPGKHHCRCEEEEANSPSPSIKTNGERKRRRSLPCGPSDVGSSCVVLGNNSLSSVSEINSRESIVKQHENENHNVHDKQDSKCIDNQPYLGTTLERYFKTQVSLEDCEGNDEKRYKPSSDVVTNYELLTNCNNIVEQNDSEDQWKFQSLKSTNNQGSTSSTISRKPNVIVNPLHENNSNFSAFVYPKSSSPCNVHLNYNKSSRNLLIAEDNDNQGIPPGDLSHLMSKLSFPKEKIVKEEGGILDWISKVPGRVLSGGQNSTSNIAGKNQDNDIQVHQEEIREDIPVKNSSGLKMKNCNLELSQREFNEVLAVLRARTPSGKRRTPVKNFKRREKIEKLIDDECFDHRANSKNLPLEPSVCPIHREVKGAPMLMMSCGCCPYKSESHGIVESLESNQNGSNKADVLLGAILRTSRDRKGISDISNGSRSETTISLDGNDCGKQENNNRAVQSNSKIIPFEDDKFLPSALNKRLIRLKQLFRKDQEPKVSTENQNTMQEMKDFSLKLNNTSNHYSSNSKDSNTLKRKIELAKLKVNIKTEQVYEPLINETINSNYDFSSSNSTNLNFVEFENDKVRGNDCNSTLNFNGCGERNGNTEYKLFQKTENWKEFSEHGKNIIYDESEDEVADRNVPSAIEQEQFRRSLENAASMVFHSRTGLPLTSSPAPLRRGSCCFDYDSSLNTVSSKRSALFELNTPPSPGAVSLEEADREVENVGEGDEPPKRLSSSRIRPQSHALLGSFEESALNGRLEPVSTVHGFTAEIGASGSFCPKHRKLPVTVFFYTLGDNDKVSTPYLAHINLGKKGYQVPRSGTIQVTLLNPLGTVVKMFVVVYDLSDMPPRSHTFLRQRTLRDKTLRYLVHLRFMSGKSGKIYLHTDIRMIICRKSDVDTASDFGSEPPKELRSYIHGPTNPKFSPRC